MDKIINIRVKNRIATVNPGEIIICGNEDYSIKFDFDDEWSGIPTKTARFYHNGRYEDHVFNGDTVAAPEFANVTHVEVGVFADEITTTPARIPCLKSILCRGGLVYEPPDDVYAEIIALINELQLNGVTDAQIAEAVEKYLAENPIEGGGGEDGGYYTPNVDSNGNLTWVASDSDMPPVASVNIKGAKGDPGEPGYTPVKGVDYVDGKDGRDGSDGSAGKDGIDGISPTVSVSKSGKVTTVTITDKNGTKTATINDGTDGAAGSAGKDGTAVTVKSVSESSADGGSNVVTFSDGKTVTIKNGNKGDKGDTGPAGSDATVTVESVTSALGYTPADVSDVFDYTEQPEFTNMLDDAGIEYGKMLNTDGTVADTAAALCVTGHIPVPVGAVIRVNEDFPLYCVEGANTPRVILFDASFAKLTHVNNTSMGNSDYYMELLEKNAAGHIVSFRINKPSTVAYMRICNHTSVVGKNPVLTVNEEITYDMGYGDKLNPDLKVDYSQITNSPQKNGWSILPHEHLSICYSGINRKPINTIEHFVDAAENFGYNTLKCDVRPTSDGELICCHDAGFTFDGNGYITAYDSGNQTKIHDVTATTCLGYSFKTGEHPCLVGDYLDVCRKHKKVAFITIRNEYMDVVIPKLLEELRVHNMTYSAIINCMTYESLVQWRQQDQTVMINYTLNFGVAIDQTQIDRAVGLGYCSLCGFSLSSAAAAPSASCDFEYARANGVRLLEAIAYHADSPETCYAMGYDGCQIGFPWGKPDGGMSESDVQSLIDSSIGAAIGGAY